MIDKTETKSAYECGLLAGDVRMPGVGGIGDPYVVIPNGAEVKSLEHLMPHPSDKRGNLRFEDWGSFSRYVKDHKGPGTLVLISAMEGRLLAHMDWHEPNGGLPGWGRHVARMNLLHTPEWLRWVNKQEWLPQREFVEWLEGVLSDVVDPPGAQLLELVSALTGRSAMEFTSVTRGDGGSVVKFESKEDVTGRWDLRVPSVLTLGLRPFVSSERYMVKSRLRVRIKDKELVFRQTLIDPHLVIDDAVAELRKKVEGAAGVEVLMG